MAGTSVAKRYARALFLQAREENVGEQVTRELTEFVKGMAKSQLEAFLISPRNPRDAKVKVVSEVLKGASSLLQRFVQLLVRRRRIAELSTILSELLELEDEARGIERAKVTTAVDMSGEQMEELKSHLSRLARKEVLVEPVVDDEIIGGVIVEIRDYVLDGSLKKEIRDIKERLRNARVV